MFCHLSCMMYNNFFHKNNIFCLQKRIHSNHICTTILIFFFGFIFFSKYQFLLDVDIFLKIWLCVVFVKSILEHKKSKMGILNTKENQYAKNVVVIENFYKRQNNCNLFYFFSFVLFCPLFIHFENFIYIRSIF